MCNRLAKYVFYQILTFKNICEMYEINKSYSPIKHCLILSLKKKHLAVIRHSRAKTTRTDNAFI